MKKPQIIIITIISLTVLAILGTTIFDSAKLISDFEKRTDNKAEFKPQAAELELAEIDKESRRGWKLKAQSGSSNADLSMVTANGVEIKVYDEAENEKLTITANKGTVDKKSGVNTLEGSAVITMAGGNQRLMANKFTIVKGKPIEGVGNVQMLLNAAGSNKLIANRVIIQPSLDDMIFYSVSRSQVSPGTFISGGALSFIKSGGRVSKYILSGGSRVQSKDTTCTSARSEFFIDGSGKPSLAVFTGSPVAVQKGNTIKAATIQYYPSDGRVKAIGGVKTRMI